MGVPSFYRWLAERYPLAVAPLEDPLGLGLGSTEAAAGAGPVDNLYIDLNGVIHPCFHPEDAPAPPSELACFEAIFAYIDALIDMAAPRKLVFIAVDGPAPRAKMNQQRGRRFRTAFDAEQKERVEAEVRAQWRRRGRTPPAKVAGAPPPPPELADSNVITPGTPFMARLGRYLRHYCYSRLNAARRGSPALRIILSDASVPGEGEHKIMEYIRAQRRAPGAPANLHHVIHGLDADLIMLALATHEPRFSILREVQKRRSGRRGGGGGGGGSGGAPAFEVVRIHVLREYLERELAPPAIDYASVRDGFNLERAIDDFVFLCFFVGNDFLPHMPALEIRDGAVDALLQLYKVSMASRLHGYLTNAGEIHLGRVEALLGQLGELEREIFSSRDFQERQERSERDARRAAQRREAREAEIERMESAMGVGGSSYGGVGRAAAVLSRKHGAPARTGFTAGGKRPREREEGEASDEEILGGGVVGRRGEPPPVIREVTSARDASEFAAELADAQAIAAESAVDDDGVGFGQPGWKDRYYAKLGISVDNSDGRRGLCAEYVRGLVWVLRYYYQGVPSWEWYYPHHYAPPASDLIDLARLVGGRTGFAVGEPFQPLEQLMAVLPPRSAKALPPPLAQLMLPPSPLSHLYPRELKLDRNGSGQLWKAVVVLPFIERGPLRAEVERAKPAIDEEARARNRFGYAYLFVGEGGGALAEEIWDLAEEHKDLDGYAMARVARPVVSDPALGATLTPFLSVPRGGTRQPPSAEMAPIAENKVAAAIIKLRPHGPHESRLRTAAAPPPPTLGKYDGPVPSADAERFGRALHTGGLDGHWQRQAWRADEAAVAPSAQQTRWR